MIRILKGELHRNVRVSMSFFERNIFKKIGVALLAGLFLLSVFRHISYPLLWNDESLVAVFAERVITYGYPKTDDGKNALNHYYQIKIGDGDLASQFIYPSLLQYYFAVPGVLVAQQVDDNYTKTALVRIPFAILGCLGLLLLGYIASRFVVEKKRLFFWMMYLAQLLLSVPLILHLRQARYNAIELFCVALILYCYYRFAVTKTIRPLVYQGSMLVLLTLMFFVFHPMYIVLVGTLLAGDVLRAHFDRLGRRNRIVSLLPLAASLVCFGLFAWYFKIFEATSFFSHLAGFSVAQYLGNVVHQLEYLWRYGLLGPAFVLFVAIVWLFQKDRGRYQTHIQLALFVFSFVSIHTLVIAATPTLLFERYFFFMGVFTGGFALVAVLAITSDVIELFQTIPITSLSSQRLAPHFVKRGIMSVLVLIFLVSLLPPLMLWRSYVRELVTPVIGPVDAFVEYVEQQYATPEDLVIATNYEETSLIYYLGSKVIVGFALPAQPTIDLPAPDVLLPRRAWGRLDTLRSLYAKAGYAPILLPVVDTPINTIPETTLSLHHLFVTPQPIEVVDALLLYVRK